MKLDSLNGYFYEAFKIDFKLLKESKYFLVFKRNKKKLAQIIFIGVSWKKITKRLTL